MCGTRTYFNNMFAAGNYPTVKLLLKHKKKFQPATCGFSREGLFIYDKHKGKNKKSNYNWYAKSQISIGISEEGKEILTIDKIKRKNRKSKKRSKIEVSPIMENMQGIYDYDTFKQTVLTHFVNSKLKMLLKISAPTLDIRELFNTTNQSKIRDAKNFDSVRHYQAAELREESKRSGHKLSEEPNSQIGLYREGVKKDAVKTLCDFTKRFAEGKKMKREKMKKAIEHNLSGNLSDKLFEYVEEINAEKEAEKMKKAEEEMPKFTHNEFEDDEKFSETRGRARFASSSGLGLDRLDHKVDEGEDPVVEKSVKTQPSPRNRSFSNVTPPKSGAAVVRTRQRAMTPTPSSTSAARDVIVRLDEKNSTKPKLLTIPPVTPKAKPIPAERKSEPRPQQTTAVPKEPTNNEPAKSEDGKPNGLNRTPVAP